MFKLGQIKKKEPIDQYMIYWMIALVVGFSVCSIAVISDYLLGRY